MNRAFPTLFLILAAPAFAAEPNIPRYHFEVGQEIVYDSSSEFRFDNGHHGTKCHLTLWVTRQNTDGSWHLVGHSQSEFSQSRGGTPGADVVNKMEQFTAFDLGSDGTVVHKPDGFQSGELTSPFPSLPKDLETARQGWQTTDAESGDTNRYRLDEAGDPTHDQWTIRQDIKGVFNEIYLMESSSRFHFDPARGLFDRIDSEYSQGWGFVGKGTGTQELKSVTVKDPTWLERFIRQSDIFFSGKAGIRSAYDDKKDTRSALNQAEAKLRESRQKVTMPLLQSQIDKALSQLDDSRKYEFNEQTEEATVDHKPSPDWQCTDLDGHSHSLADYRGKVIILDFWYRGCGWCIKAMPQIKEVVDHYQGKPVVVLGMNTDSNEKDARFVAEKLALNYITLKATGLPDKYKIHGFPTLIIIDQNGVVSGRHKGYSPTLRDSIFHDIDALLAGPKD